MAKVMMDLLPAKPAHKPAAQSPAASPRRQEDKLPQTSFQSELNKAKTQQVKPAARASGGQQTQTAKSGQGKEASAAPSRGAKTAANRGQQQDKDQDAKTIAAGDARKAQTGKSVKAAAGKQQEESSAEQESHSAGPSKNSPRAVKDATEQPPEKNPSQQRDSRDKDGSSKPQTQTATPDASLVAVDPATVPLAAQQQADLNFTPAWAAGKAAANAATGQPTAGGDDASAPDDAGQASPSAAQTDGSDAALLAKLTSADLPGQVAGVETASDDKAPALHPDAKSAGDVLPADMLAPSVTPTDTGAAGSAAAPAASPATQFADANYTQVVAGIRTQLLPSGGTMQIHLDPPDLGALQITVKMVKGTLTASFETSNEQATRLVSHSLSQLKDALENQGMTVGRLHVQQSAPSDQSSQKQSNGDGQSSADQSAAQQEQQRREALRRMWRRLSGDGDPLDLVA